MAASTLLPSSAAIRVADDRCTASRHDPAVVESHTSFTIAYVRRGSCRARGDRDVFLALR